MERPNPEPCRAWISFISACSKRLKIDWIRFLGMPIPISLILNTKFDSSL